jgi:hypothetical protein
MNVVFGPQLLFNNPYLEAQVGVALLGFKAATHILISKDTFLFSVEGQLFGGLFWANVYAYLARARVRAACVSEGVSE